MVFLTEKDIDPFLDLGNEINRLREDMNAIILAHYYQDAEIQDIADFVGDSLDLSKKAAATNAEVIVFCGVKFMAEVAKILNPSKLVLLPDINAGCSLEQSCPPDKFKTFREDNPDHISITYINCSAEIKALSDIIVTSSNAEYIINNLPKNQKIIFAPDKYLGGYLSRKTGRKMLLWEGTCQVHEQFSEKELIKLKTKYPDAHIIAHPECTEILLKYANHIGSTKSLLNYVTSKNGDSFIVLTEPGIIHQMKKFSPDSILYQVPGTEEGCTSCNECPFMKLNTIEKLYLAMMNKAPSIQIEQNIINKAELSLNRMLELGSQS